MRPEKEWNPIPEKPKKKIRPPTSFANKRIGTEYVFYTKGYNNVCEDWKSIYPRKNVNVLIN